MMIYITQSLLRKQLFIVSFFLFLTPVFSAFSQQGLTLTEYIERYKEIAMEEMRLHGIPASIKLGQGILESGFGNSDLAAIANNHFGIKCHGWQGRTFYKDDDAADECFRAYDDPYQSFRDHSEFLTGRPRYASLFELEVTNYKAWARGLRQAGYATNPRYPELLIGVIERNKLYEFDRMVVSSGGFAEGRVARQSERSSNGGTRRQQNRVDDFPAVTLGRDIGEFNRIRYVIARAGDTPESLASEVGVWAWEIYRYNDLKQNDRLKEGQRVYLQPKRRNASQGWHVVQDGETMYDISQKYGVKLRLLYRRNSMKPGDRPEPGQRLRLRYSVR
jgi:LysM repeat protein